MIGDSLLLLLRNKSKLSPINTNQQWNLYSAWLLSSISIAA